MLCSRGDASQQVDEEIPFAISGRAEDLLGRFRQYLEEKAHTAEFEQSLAEVSSSLPSAFLLSRDWVRAFLDAQQLTAEAGQLADELAQLLVEGEFHESRVIHNSVVRDLSGMIGSHKCIDNGQYHLDFNEFMARLNHFQRVIVPRFRDFTRLKHELVEKEREELRLDEFKPRVLTSFVRNRLIDKVYLPLVGDNLAKQLGTAGETKRTDRMGLLLLISPPGYGKTTLMEYIANRLGLIFMKINGPAIGHQVTSLDPGEAPNAAAREEIEKLNLSAGDGR